MLDFARRTIKASPWLYRAVNKIRGWRLDDPDTKTEIILVGGDGGLHNYGAWAIPASLFLDHASIVYAFGVGFDISFDLQLINGFGTVVQAFDPGDDVAAFVAAQKLPEEFVFHKYGLGTSNGTTSFTASDNGAFYRIPDSQSDDQHVMLPTKSLPTIMKELGHDKIDLLTMDIEGFEYPVIKHMLLNAICPKCILVEFHHYQKKTPHLTRESVKLLKDAGYSIFWVSDLGAEYGFIR
jgi:FkbM family methyltransferase